MAEYTRVPAMESFLSHSIYCNCNFCSYPKINQKNILFCFALVFFFLFTVSLPFSSLFIVRLPLRISGIRALSWLCVSMASEMNEVVSALHKISMDISSFTDRHEQLEVVQEQSIRHQEESFSELREVLNEVIHGGKRPERDKKVTHDEGELYSHSDKPFDFEDVATPSTSNVNNTSSNALISPVSALIQNPRPAVTSTPASGVPSPTPPAVQPMHAIATQTQLQPRSISLVMMNTPHTTTPVSTLWDPKSLLSLTLNHRIPTSKFSYTTSSWKVL